jgi:hypothetical protein
MISANCVSVEWHVAMILNVRASCCLCCEDDSLLLLLLILNFYDVYVITHFTTFCCNLMAITSLFATALFLQTTGKKVATNVTYISRNVSRGGSMLY